MICLKCIKSLLNTFPIRWGSAWLSITRWSITALHDENGVTSTLELNRCTLIGASRSHSISTGAYYGPIVIIFPVSSRVKYSSKKHNIYSKERESTKSKHRHTLTANVKQASRIREEGEALRSKWPTSRSSYSYSLLPVLWSWLLLLLWRRRRRRTVSSCWRRWLWGRCRWRLASCRRS